MEKEIITPNALKETLKQFRGTEMYHHHSIAGSCKIFLTDGCQYLAETAACYWLFDLIASYQYKQEVNKAVIQIWKFKKQTDNSWKIDCTDGNGVNLVTQHITYSDFPLDEFAIWFKDNVAMLPGEY